MVYVFCFVVSFLCFLILLSESVVNLFCVSLLSVLWNFYYMVLLLISILLIYVFDFFVLFWLLLFFVFWILFIWLELRILVILVFLYFIFILLFFILGFVCVFLRMFVLIGGNFNLLMYFRMWFIFFWRILYIFYNCFLVIVILVKFCFKWFIIEIIVFFILFL